jgi:hypothetical protein
VEPDGSKIIFQQRRVGHQLVECPVELEVASLAGEQQRNAANSFEP